ncbi:hypothetical protein [Terrabacter carboxydivorans]|uniref:Uncharacterized protein n=1 Tax=Terrabacter carboxydivorans TaxID=619730 RepID=A0ABP5XXE1_9MICO
MTGSQRLVLAGAIAAMLGGLFWAMKATGLMVARYQPPVVYEIAPIFFAFAVIGLHASLGASRSRLARAGLVLAGIAELCAVVAALGQFLGPADWIPTGDTVTVLTPFITLSMLGSVAGLLLVGLVVRRTAALPGRWAGYPLALAISVIPLIASSAVFQAIHPRLFELPTLVVGLGWIVLGAVMARRPPTRPGEHPEDA